MGVIIYPSKVKEKTKSMNQELETLKEEIAATKEAQNGLSRNDLMLMGFAWDSARNYVNEIQIPLLEMTSMWIEAEMEGNRAYQAAATRLPQVYCLDEDQLKRHIQEWQKEIRYEERSEYPSWRFINRLQGYIRDTYAKLEAMRTFVHTTEGIYDKARDIQQILSKAETELKNVHYNPETTTVDFTTVNPDWILELEWMQQLLRGRKFKNRALVERK